MASIVVPFMLASDGTVGASDHELWIYAMTGVALLVVGCMLTILANARRAAADRTRATRHIVDDPRLSPSVNRLQHDVRGWLKRTS